ncbi:hypothetical protein AN478_10975 [Thiohalorhabdus denitrificans]|nr:hypothetical protein AN478_10975 [Thiohalorhabdus denitrificans]
MPEARLLGLGLPLELLWEVAQFPLYTVWHQASWGYSLFALVHCTFGDLLILLGAFELSALALGSRRWLAEAPLRFLVGAGLFIFLGAAYTVFSEIWNVQVRGNWAYTELMPLLPGLEVGATPFLQWVLIPPVLVGYLRILERAHAQSP